jgi:hypothetical protein
MFSWRNDFVIPELTISDKILQQGGKCNKLFFNRKYFWNQMFHRFEQLNFHHY